VVTGTNNPPSVTEVWKSNSISGEPTISSFRTGGGYGGFSNNAPTGTLGFDEDIAALIDAPSVEIKKWSNLLKNAKYLKTTKRKYDRLLGDAIVNARSDFETEKARTGRPELTFEQYLVENAQAGGTKPNLPTEYIGIAGATQAQNLITDVWKRELNREPTAEELTKITTKLQKAQKKNPTVQTYEIVNGRRVQTTKGGIDEAQFLTNVVRKLPEFSEKKKAAADLTRQELAKTAAANGLDLNRDFGTSVDAWTKQIADGADVDTFKNLIRQTARLGMPDRVANLLDQGIDLETVYAPYKKLMAATLEVNPDTIALNDPTLRGAIGQDREMTLYDFQRQLRKDPRWQYTNNAREEVSDAALRVLKDFGFQG
jgi:hypothetical protein